MNTTENKPIPKAPTAEATDPTTLVMDEESKFGSKACMIQSTAATWILKSGSRLGTIPANHWLNRSKMALISPPVTEAVCRFTEIFCTML